MLIAAMSENRVIGNKGKIPWDFFKEDMIRFRRLTINHTVVMGRKTCESLTGPLKDRLNIVLTRSTDYYKHGFITLNNSNKIMEISETTDIFIIGGQEIYELFLPCAEKIFLTKINEQFNGDTFFPKFDKKEWNVEYKENKNEYNFIDYQRKLPLC